MERPWCPMSWMWTKPRISLTLNPGYTVRSTLGMLHACLCADKGRKRKFTREAYMTRSTWILALAAASTLATSALTQQGDAPRNDLPQSYRTTRDWGELPAGMKWAAVTAIEQAPDGSIYVIHRCFENSCAGRSEPPILKYDPGGKLLKALGVGLFVWPHGADVDR